MKIQIDDANRRAKRTMTEIPEFEKIEKSFKMNNKNKNQAFIG